MTLKPLSILVAAATLSGCLLDDAETGTFPIPGIKGLTYETSTQSGSLNNSQFKFEEGESVQIKLGNQTLFTLDAESAIEFEELISQWPSTEEELQQAYFENDQFEAFQYLANFMQLIHNLDADGDADNGFDLSQYSNEQNLDIDLSVTPDTFYTTTLLELADTLGSQRSAAPMNSIGQLFDLGGSHIAIEQLATQASDDDNDGTTDEIRTYQYDEMGLELGYQEDSNGDDISDNQFTYAYNASGLQTSQLSETDFDYDGSFDRVWGETTEFNELNLPSSATFYSDHNGDGISDYETLAEYEYNSKGLVINEVETELNSEGGADSYTYLAYSYNDDDQLTQKVVTSDDDADGSIDSKKIYTYSYTATGKLLQEIRSDDDDNDGVEDERRIEDYTYNENDEQLSIALKDYDNEGTLGFNQTQLYTYNAAGEQLTYQLIVDYYGDGDANFEGTTTRTYDEGGNILTSLSVNYREGELSDRYLTSYTYNEAGKQTQYKKEEDNDLDGTYDSTIVRNYTYTAEGNYASWDAYEDEDNDGTNEEESTRTYSYSINQEGEKSLLQEFVNWW